ncbi:hypothetical protein CEXT_773121 [Caerostris extrusa]|uniref:Uncharacterized protein n=1 Tax=Caerostris extrusa TaxID=172846 RepID=A0AAV4QHR1_CAEEX|nr:hypothetical protein CEXT_773121 [Caerostris extrusa]
MAPPGREPETCGTRPLATLETLEKTVMQTSCLQKVSVEVENNIIKGIVDTSAEVKVSRQELIDYCTRERELRKGPDYIYGR